MESDGRVNKKEVVQNLRSKLSESPALVQRSLTEAIHTICHRFDPRHVPIELLQNADDAGASKITFALSEDESNLRVYDDGGGFCSDGIRSLVEIGSSTKPASTPHTTGGGGIGGLSYFAVANEIAIHSNGYHLRFPRNRVNTDSKDTLPPVAPEWIEKPAQSSPKSVQQAKDSVVTLIELSLLESVSASDLLSEHQLSTIDFLFLYGIVFDSIETIRISGPSVTRTISFTDRMQSDQETAIDTQFEQKVRSNATPDDTIEAVEINRVETTTDGETNRWIKFCVDCEVPESILRPKARRNQNSAQLVAFLKLSQAGQVQLVDTNGKIRLTSREMYSPPDEFGYLLGCDFETYPDGRTIRPDHPWNNYLARVLQEVFLNSLIATLGTNNNAAPDVQALISEPGIQKDFVSEHVFDPLRSRLE